MSPTHNSITIADVAKLLGRRIDTTVVGKRIMCEHNQYRIEMLLEHNRDIGDRIGDGADQTILYPFDVDTSAADTSVDTSAETAYVTFVFAVYRNATRVLFKKSGRVIARQDIISDSRATTPRILELYTECNQWISPSQMYDPIIGGHRIAWLTHYPIMISATNSAANTTTELTISPSKQELFEYGRQHEERVVYVLKQRLIQLNVPYVQHNTSISCLDIGKLTPPSATELSVAPVHFQLFVSDKSLRTYGYIDVLIRGNVLKLLFGQSVPDVAPVSDNSWYVVDIKSGKRKCLSDGSMSRLASYEPDRAQLWMYTRMIGNMCAESANGSYVCDREFRLVYVEPPRSEDVLKYEKCIEWIRSMKRDGHMWTQTTNPELFPNTKLKSTYSEIDESIRRTALEQKELTELCWVTPTMREELLQKGIRDYMDPRLTGKMLFPNNAKRAELMENMLRSQRTDKIVQRSNPTPLPYSDERAMFVDFETTSNDFVFMIGYSSTVPNGLPIDRNIFQDVARLKNGGSITKAERAVVKSFLDRIKMDRIRVIYTWGVFEKTQLNALQERHPRLRWEVFDSVEIVDVHRWVNDEAIGFPGATNYSIKSVGKALYGRGLIRSSWDQCEYLANGQDAMQLADKYYEDAMYGTADEETMDMIKAYNASDVMVLKDICSLFGRRDV
jgi:uncharacterized protein YprB with RNaseH-like and TPR domain